MSNLVFKSDGIYQKMWLDDKEHGLGNTEHLKQLNIY